MVLVFNKMQGHELTECQKKHYKNQLSKISRFDSFLGNLNRGYNNIIHGVRPNFPDVETFLKDIERVIRSKEDTLEVNGTEHYDPSYRKSPLVVYQNPWTGLFEEAMIRDKYLTLFFKPAFHNQIGHNYRGLTTNYNYHLIVALPEVQNDYMVPFYRQLF